MRLQALLATTVLTLVLAGCTAIQRVDTETALARALVSDEQMGRCPGCARTP
jgi:hypothetical protein